VQILKISKRKSRTENRNLAEKKLRFLETLNEEVLYYDTDSVIYLSKNGEKLIPTNEYLGSMSNKLKNFGEMHIFQSF